MKFIDLKNAFSPTKVLDIRNITNVFGPIDRRRLYEWQKKGYIKKLCSNFYIFTDTEVDDIFLWMTSNVIYSPSYIGLESALAYYGLIPEAVFQVIGVTTRKTRKIQTGIASFTYRTIHKRLYWGYVLKAETTNKFYISDPEKTLLDYLYFNPRLDDLNAIEEVRLNREVFRSTVNVSKLRRYLKIFSHNRLNQTVTKLFEVLDVKF